VSAALGATLGTSLAWYDFFLYASAATLVFPTVFFPDRDPGAGLLAGFGIYAVGFAARPLGALWLGRLGDRIGRRATLIATVSLMGLATLLVAAVPGYALIGLWGAALVTVLRLVQGLALGGEWGVATLLPMEWGSPRHRGLAASWPQIGMPLGLILGFLALPAIRAVSGSGFFVWGWRIPFLLSILLFGAATYARLRAQETPVFRAMFDERRIEPRPVVEAFASATREMVLSALLRASELVPFTLLTTFVLAYSTGMVKLSGQLLLYSALAGAGLAILAVPLAGHLSDQFGRRRTCLLAALAMAAWAYPLFLLLNTDVPVLVVLAVVVGMVLVGVQAGSQAVLIAESFTPRLRASGSSIGSQLAWVVASAPVPLIAAALAGASHRWFAVAGYMAVWAAISGGAALLMADHSTADQAREYERPISKRSGASGFRTASTGT
jgi:MFS family permease